MVRSNERARGRSRSRSPRPSASYRRDHGRSRSRSPRRRRSRRSRSPSWSRRRSRSRRRRSPVRAPDCWDVRGPRPTLVAPAPAPPARLAVDDVVATATQRRQQLLSVVHTVTTPAAVDDGVGGEGRRSRIAMQCRGRSWSPARPLSPLRCSINARRDGGRVVRTLGRSDERTTANAERFREAMNIERRVKFRVTLHGRKGRRRDAMPPPPPDPIVASAAASFIDRMDAGVAAAKRRLRQNALQATDALRNKPWS